MNFSRQASTPASLSEWLNQVNEMHKEHERILKMLVERGNT